MTAQRRVINSIFVAFPACLACFLSVFARADEGQSHLSDKERYHSCLEKVEKDPETAFEDALIWRDQGGQALARHCIAAALLTLGHPAEAALRLEDLAQQPYAGDSQTRVEYMLLAIDAWLQAKKPEDALRIVSAGLLLIPNSQELLIRHGYVRAAQNMWASAETAWNKVLSVSPKNAEALRERARARKMLGQFDEALTDIEASLALKEDDVKTLLLRGEIREALRLNIKKQKKKSLH